MSSNTRQLLTERRFLTAGGTETYLLFQQRFPMREFCAFEVFEDEDALSRLEDEYLYPLVTAVDSHGHGLLLDALVWRAHPDYVSALGYPPEDLTRLNRLAVERTRAAIDSWRERASRSFEQFPVLIAADIGPRGDGYQASEVSVEDAFQYHRAQLQALAGADIDAVCAWTMTSADEATGVVKAAAELDRPILISATVETDGRLPDGTTLRDFVHRVDEATDALPVFYMVNCAHPTHVNPALEAARERGEDWLTRFKGFRANSSKKSHEELDNSTELDRGNPEELANEVAEMQRDFSLRVVGGCCGTDAEHIAAIARVTA